MITLKDVTKSYNNKNVVDKISFTIKEGELFGFLGPNGAGKTTTIKMLIGLLKPNQGEIKINGIDVLKNTKEIYKDIGVVFELPNLYMRASIKNNLKLFANLYGLPEKRVNEVMEDLQLCEKKEVKVDKLSKGWKQRVLIARALLHNPKVLILDEPTSGLDPNTAELIRRYIKNLNNEGTTVILTTHDMHEADELSDRVGIMHNGKIVAIGKPSELKSKYLKQDIKIEYINNHKVITKILEAGTKETKALIVQLVNEEKLISMNSNQNSLADVFAALTGRELN